MEVSHHELQDGQWQSVKPLVFVLDEPKEEKTKRERGKSQKNKGGPQMTIKNFGAWISVTKLKTCSDTVSIVWRCRSLV